jgi:hypothetical protein
MGLFRERAYEFVLANPSLNLWEGIREDAIEYFARNQIHWWGDDGRHHPTGHLLSSQIACLNHLYALRQRPELAKAVLHAIDHEVTAAEVVDDGYVEFEFIGTKQYMKERSFSRGANCTSVDAFMIGRDIDGSRRAFLIEWKYTESCEPEDKYIPRRSEVYDSVILATDSPFAHVDPKAFYFEPFYQLMRQTLLGWLLAKNKDHGCTSYRHVQIVPAENVEFQDNVTSPYLKGASVSEAWSSVLRQSDLYIATTPAKFMRPVVDGRDTQSLTNYLQRRYWSGI